MNVRSQTAHDNLYSGPNVLLSRRVAAAALGAALSAIVTGSAFGQEQETDDNEAIRESIEKGQQKLQEMRRQVLEAQRKERLEKLPPEERAFREQMDNASSVDEQQRLFQGWHVRNMQARLSKELGVSAEEWAVIQPRIAEILYLLQAPTGGGGSPAGLLVAQGYKELMVLLENKEAKPEEIKAKLTSLRAARAQAQQELNKARQDLRKLMTLRQEARLVLAGVLE